MTKEKSTGKRRFSLRKKKKNLIPVSEEVQEVVQTNTYLPYPKAYISIHNMSMSSRILAVKVDHYLQHKETCIPVVDKGRVTWNILEQHNKPFSRLRKEVEEIQNHKFKDHSLDLIAERVVKFITKEHQLKSVPEPV